MSIPFNLTVLIFSFAALVLPHLCCCFDLPSVSENSDSHSCCHSSTPKSRSAANLEFASYTIKNPCGCDQHSFSKLYVSSNSESSLSLEQHELTVFLPGFLQQDEDSYEWKSYNIKRGPPDYIARESKRTYLSNQTFLL